MWGSWSDVGCDQPLWAQAHHKRCLLPEWWACAPKRAGPTLRHFQRSINMFGYGNRLSKIAWISTMAILCFLALGVWSKWYRPEMLSGDGKIVDLGFWTYPRYIVTFPRFEVANSTRTVFRVKGLPRDPMTFSLVAVLPDRSESFATVGLNGDWTFKVRILDDHGQEVYGITAPLSEWHMTRFTDASSLWHESLSDLSFSPDREYLIEIQISGSQTSSGVFLEPRLAGGGNELP